MPAQQPNILIILTDQQRYPPVYESNELRRFCPEVLTAETSLRDSAVSARSSLHYVGGISASHADLLPRYPALPASIATRRSSALPPNHTEARPLVGRDLSGLIRGTGGAATVRAGPLHDRRRDQRGQRDAWQPIAALGPAAGVYECVVQPNHIETVVAKVEVDGEQHLVKLSRYHDNQQFWTVPGVRDERL